MLKRVLLTTLTAGLTGCGSNGSPAAPVSSTNPAPSLQGRWVGHFPGSSDQLTPDFRSGMELDLQHTANGWKGAGLVVHGRAIEARMARAQSEGGKVRIS